MKLSIVVAKPRHLEEGDLCAWLGDALPGDQMIYHRGVLAFDCNPLTSRLPKADRARLNRLARRARQAADMGFAHLVQRRHGPDDYSYIIIAGRRHKSDRRPISAGLSERCAAL